MRITGGTVRGRKLHSPSSDNVIRPTSDRVREALFSILAQKIEGSLVLDIFAGTGALGIEALSRGARFAVFADQSKASAELIRSNLTTCFPSPQASFVQVNLSLEKAFIKIQKKLPPQSGFDLIFMDPPYRKDLVLPVLKQIEATKLLAPDGYIVVEEHRQVDLPETAINFQVVDHRIYGETGIWIYAYSQPYTYQ